MTERLWLHLLHSVSFAHYTSDVATDLRQFAKLCGLPMPPDDLAFSGWRRWMEDEHGITNGIFSVDKQRSPNDVRASIYHAIENERANQDERWGAAFDERNTPNDWVAYIVQYAGKAVTLPWDRIGFRRALLKIAAICVAALERHDYAGRHYDHAARVR